MPRIYTVIALLVASLITRITADQTFECKDNATELTADEGILFIKRSVGSCEFMARPDSQLFVIQTDSLDLHSRDSLTIQSMDTKTTIHSVIGPQEEGFFVLGEKRTKLTFSFDPQDKSDSTMTVRFFQFSKPDQAIPVPGDKKRDLVIRNIEVEHDYKLSVTKSISDYVYVEEVGDNKFGHFLITESGGLVPIEASVDKTFTVRLSPALGGCSANHEMSSESSFEIDGPGNILVASRDYYTCVHIFKTTMTGRAHFDVSFVNFSDMLDVADELIISDGSQELVVTRSNYKDYKSLFSSISFKGQNLVVVYDSPRKINRLSTQLLLSVSARSLGGIVDEYDYTFDIPSNGTALYSLKRPSGQSGNIALEFSKFTGATVKFYNRQNKFVSLDTKIFSDIITFNPEDDVRVEFSADGQTTISGKVTYKPGNKCSGTLFKPSGSISIIDRNMTCNWFLGAQSNVLNINLNDLKTGGSLEIYSLSRDQSIPVPLFIKKNMAPTEVLPPMLISHPVYLKIQLGSTQSSFDAFVSPLTTTQVSSTSGSQDTFTSIGYPTSHHWIDLTEKYLVYGVQGKQVVLSVADLDLRDGEKMLVDTTAITESPWDYTPQNNLVNVTIERSISADFRPHRGYRLVTTNFQQTFDADIKQNQITTPKNLTSLLLRIPGDTGKRISYDIAFSEIPGTQVDVFDSKSIAGRRVDPNEERTGSTTSNVLLVSFSATMEGIYVPELTVKYSQIPCNQAVGDHPCDGSSRCVPVEKLCKGLSYCADGSDLKVSCSDGPTPPPPPPKEVRTGASWGTVFLLSILMLTIGALADRYGATFYKKIQSRHRSGQYTAFQLFRDGETPE